MDELNILEQFLQKKPFLSKEDIYTNERLMRFPDDFNPCNKERIRIFSQRLRQARLDISSGVHQPWSETVFGKVQYVSTLKQAGEWLGVTEAMISYYESGKISKIPMKYLLAFYDMYDVTPHYLTGYTSKPDRILGIGIDPKKPKTYGKFLKNEDGTYREVIMPIAHPLVSEGKTCKLLCTLAWSNVEWFRTLCKFLCCSDRTLKAGFAQLKKLVEKEEAETLAAAEEAAAAEAAADEQV